MLESPLSNQEYSGFNSKFNTSLMSPVPGSLPLGLEQALLQAVGELRAVRILTVVFKTTTQLIITGYC